MKGRKILGFFISIFQFWVIIRYLFFFFISFITFLIYSITLQRISYSCHNYTVWNRVYTFTPVRLIPFLSDDATFSREKEEGKISPYWIFKTGKPRFSMRRIFHRFLDLSSSNFEDKRREGGCCYASVHRCVFFPFPEYCEETRLIIVFPENRET